MSLMWENTETNLTIINELNYNAIEYSVQACSLQTFHSTCKF